MVELVWLIPAFPLLGFAVLLAFGRRLGDPVAGWLATLMVAGSFGATVVVFAGLVSRNPDQRFYLQTLFEWIAVGNFGVDVGFLVDPLSVTMALFITGIASLIHLYAIGYMRGDERFPKFFVYLNLFVFSMLMLVLGDNLLITFVGWEGVGACSYLLISFWFEDGANASAGKKAFVTNRVGDWGFLTATFLTFTAVGSIRYADIVVSAPGLAGVTATAIALLLFVGACGKSAQLPLYVWLPDAMAGPTPVSALIHAATMVTAGVFLMVRMSPVLEAAYTWAPTIVAWVGGLTALFAATVAVAQNDIKKVLAYSTVSQLGYLFMAVGLGAYVPAIFHTVTHAFFKALLFLAAGSVIHGMHHEQDMRRFGGLHKLLPITAVTFIIGWLAIAGVPPFAGFWSKDEILAYAWQENKALWVIGLLTALLTAFYMSRQVFLTFFGRYRFGDPSADELVAAWDAKVAAAEVDATASDEAVQVANAALDSARAKVTDAEATHDKVLHAATEARAAADAVSAADIEAARAAVGAAGDDKDARKAADRMVKDLEKPAKDAEKADAAAAKAQTALVAARDALSQAETGLLAARARTAAAQESMGVVRRQAEAARPALHAGVVALDAAPDDREVADFLPHEVEHRRHYHPHESPWTMTVPLGVLAVGAVGAGAFNLPFADNLHVLEKWLEPSLFGGETHLGVSGAGLFGLAAVAVILALAGIAAAAMVYLRGQGDRSRIEQPILARAWRVDEAYAAFMGGPGRLVFSFLSAFDRTVVDGAVNGAATVVRESAGELRKTQTGFVRSYALGISVGAVILLGLVLSKAGF
ncbi:MAG: NADH-quinone oxidoreductase subunit L [Acidimicrobiales bacterium]